MALPQEPQFIMEIKEEILNIVSPKFISPKTDLVSYMFFTVKICIQMYTGNLFYI